MKEPFKTGALFALNNLGVNHFFRNRARNRTIVLMYHGVTKDHWDVANNNWLQVKESIFRKQMEHLAKYYNVVSLKYALKTIDQPSSKPKVVITFDDGYANNYTVAYPILKELNLHATIFLVSDMISTKNLFWYDRLRITLSGNCEPRERIEWLVQSYKEKHPHSIDELVDKLIHEYRISIEKQHHLAYGVLSYEQILEMQSSGLISFDSHTHQHEILTQLNEGEPYETISKSLEILRGHNIKCGNIFCYPNGLYYPEHFDVLKKLGFKAAMSTECRHWKSYDNVYAIPRYGVGRNMTAIQFESFISGMWRGIAGKLKHLKQIGI